MITSMGRLSFKLGLQLFEAIRVKSQCGVYSIDAFGIGTHNFQPGLDGVGQSVFSTHKDDGLLGRIPLRCNALPPSENPEILFYILDSFEGSGHIDRFLAS